MNVYVLTVGRYSDYRIEGIYETEDAALAALDAMKRAKGDDYVEYPEIEEWTVSHSFDGCDVCDAWLKAL